MTNPKIEVLPIEKGATPDLQNVNKHTQRGRGLHENSMRKRGAGRSIFSAGKDAEIPVVMGGNQTLEIAATLGMEIINVHTTGNQIVNVVRDDIEPGSPEFYAMGLEDNEIGKQSYNPDLDILAAVMADPAMQALRDEDKILGGIIEGMGLKGETVDAEPQFDRAAELAEKWETAMGQLWKLGEHRLLIGDSLDRENWVKLCGEERATLTWTDPPYGVNYGEKLESSNPMGYRVRTIENDDLPPNQLEEFVRTALKNCAEFSEKGAAIYVACPAGTLLPAIISAMAGSGYDYRWHLVWVKDQIVLSRADYHFKHENILYGWKPDGAHYFIDDRKQSSVFEYPRPKKSEEHPTMKPVELVEHMIKNSSRVGDIVLEPFGGSGTTLLACQRQGRICRVVELSENYGAVILERFYTATGITPELVK